MAVTNDDSRPEINIWLDRARRMVDYREEATDFLRRASSTLPATQADVELICQLWATADEHDTSICEALQRFDEALFDVPGQLEITRGAEPTPTPDNSEGLAYLCTWALLRPDGRGISVVLAADQTSGRLDFEVRGGDDAGCSIGFPIGDPIDLYEPLMHSFFTLQGNSITG